MGRDKKPRSIMSLLMKVAIAFSLLFLLSAGGLYVYGTTAPESHEASGSRTINAPVGDVFALKHDPRRATEWRDDVAEIRYFENHGEGIVSWTEVWTDGNRFDFRVVEYARNKRLKIRINDVSDYFNGTWTCDFEEEDGGTLVTITENGNIPNPFIRALHRLSANPAEPLTKRLDELEAHFAG